MKNIKFKQIIYPALSAIFMLIVAALFFFVIRFFVQIITATFSVDTKSIESQVVRLDLENFKLVAKKLGIQVNETVTGSELGTETDAVEDNSENSTSKETVATSTEVKSIESSNQITAPSTQIEQPDSTISTSTMAESIMGEVMKNATSSASLTSIESDIKSLKISVLNGTKIFGLAGKLKNDLVAEGYIVDNTGNKQGAFNATTIQIKASKNGFLEKIKEIVSRNFTLGGDEILSEDGLYDIIIIIGGSPK